MDSDWLKLQQTVAQICPYLETVDDILAPSADASAFIALYERVVRQYPEAGAAFAKTRLYGLLFWQPFFLAFISIYATDKLVRLKDLKQYTQPLFVKGVGIVKPEFISADKESLIHFAVRDIQRLSEHYIEQIGPQYLPRERMMRRLLCDQLLGCFVHLEPLWLNYSINYRLEQASLWLDAFGFKQQALNQLSFQDHQLAMVRDTCCLAYKCQGRQYCRNCPLSKKPQQTLSRSHHAKLS
ncbi:siderophore ferric iron reductase [Celerinatantimonas sp. MCCC 1A17872]|uniref:siderophore ferric iron reductase n=1 Tax=Celerinatantimonas sp. MCCC 1A17872 TaxID=3177514 RepID=UPI0038C60734